MLTRLSYQQDSNSLGEAEIVIVLEELARWRTLGRAGCLKNGGRQQ